MSIDLFVNKPTVVPKARGIFIELVRERVGMGGLLDKEDLNWLDKKCKNEFDKHEEARSFLREALEQSSDGMIAVTFG